MLTDNTFNHLETGNVDDKFHSHMLMIHTLLSSTKIFQYFPVILKAFTSELLENYEEKLPRYYMNRDESSMFLTTQ